MPLHKINVLYQTSAHNCKTSENGRLYNDCLANKNRVTNKGNHKVHKRNTVTMEILIPNKVSILNANID